MGWYLIMGWNPDGTPDKINPITESCANAYIKANMQKMLTSDYKMKQEAERQEELKKETRDIF